MASPQNPQTPAAQQPQGPTENAKKYAWPLPPQEPKILSSHVKRVDGPNKVTGRAKYTFDISRPGMLYAKVVRSPHPHAKITAIDVSAARRAPGVKAVINWKDPGAEVMYQGDPVAAIAAATEEQARDAARLIKVDYETLPHLVREDEVKMAEGAPKIFPTGNTRVGPTQEVGSLDAGFKAAAHTIEQSYSTH